MLPPEPARGRGRLAGALTPLAAITCAVVLLAGIAILSYRVGAGRASLPGAALRAPQSTVDAADGDIVDEVLGLVRSEAVDVPEDGVLVKGAVEGLLRALDDPYAQYYDAGDFAAFNDLLDGEFSGVGLVLQETPKGLTVVSVLDGTPADRAGITKGERIVSVDGRDVRGKPIDAVVDLVKGEEGTQVTLGLVGGPQGRHEVTLTRQRIDLPLLEARRLDDGNGYVKLLQFSGGSGERVRRAVDRLVAGGAQGIVLDLRNNPGGLLSEAISVASVFIEDGLVVSVQERGTQRRTYEAGGDALEDIPLVVLVDKGSASASEIVAGAIQDQDRGTIVGVGTFGKGTVQTIERLDAGGGVKFTTAEYFTPSGDSIEGLGVKPDQRVAGEKAQLGVAKRVLQSMVASGQRG